MIDAIIQPSKLEDVKEALGKIDIIRMTISEVKGFGRQKGYTEVFRDQKFTVNLLPKVELKIVVNEEFVESVLQAIVASARSGPDGKIGDGKVFVWDLADCVRIRTGPTHGSPQQGPRTGRRRGSRCGTNSGGGWSPAPERWAIDCGRK